MTIDYVESIQNISNLDKNSNCNTCINDSKHLSNEKESHNDFSIQVLKKKIHWYYCCKKLNQINVCLTAENKSWIKKK